MSRIDFYVLPQNDKLSRLQFAARLSEKALRANLKVLILASQDDMAELDEQLWHFKPESFVPHSVESEAPVVLSSDLNLAYKHDFLINLTTGQPSSLNSTPRLAEVVIQTPEVLEHTRQNYALYKRQGWQIHTHKIS